MAYKINNVNVISSANVTSTFNALNVDNEIVFDNFFQGSIAGYSGGARSMSLPPGSYYNAIQSFNFASTNNASLPGALLTTGRGLGGSASSANHGYLSGGSGAGGNIEKFPFANNNNSASVGSLPSNITGSGGTNSLTTGYHFGGYTPSNRIQKYPFASDTNATNTNNPMGGAYSYGMRFMGKAGTHSQIAGYAAGGAYTPGPPYFMVNYVKFPFATESGVTGGTNYLGGYYDGATAASQNKGYRIAGRAGPFQWSTSFGEWQFVNDSNMVGVGSLIQGQGHASTSDSVTSGFVFSGRTAPGSVFTDTIQRFPYSASTPTTDVSNLVTGSYGNSGHQR